jgi:DNA repair protein RadC
MNRVMENLATFGPETLSDAQLIGVLLNINLLDRVEEILNAAGSMKHLFDAGPAELREHGLSDLETARLSVLPELLGRMTRSGSERPIILSAFHAIPYLKPRCVGWQEEHFGMLALNAKGELLADREISKGTATGTLISPREFFREALRYGATSALAWHNHPSGNPTPSREDCILTKRLRQAGKTMDVPLADHIIIGQQANFSFREVEGWDG